MCRRVVHYSDGDLRIIPPANARFQALQFWKRAKGYYYRQPRIMSAYVHFVPNAPRKKGTAITSDMDHPAVRFQNAAHVSRPGTGRRNTHARLPDSVC